MKCVILSAGLGSRLKPFTINHPKPMLPIGNKPIIEHVINQVKSIGIKDIYINLYHQPKIIEDFLGDGSKFGVNITYRTERMLTGPAGALKVFEDLFEKEEPILVLSGDGVHNVNLSELIISHNDSKSDLTVVTKKVKNPGRYGVIKINGRNEITEFLEKPSLPVDAEELVSCGIYCLNSDLVKDVPTNQIYDYVHIINSMIVLNNKVNVYVTDSYWSDVGTPQTLIQTNLELVQGEFNLPLTPVENSSLNSTNLIIEGQVLIGDGVKISGDVHIIGPAIIGDNSIIKENVVIKESVLLPGSKLDKDSVIINGLVGTH